MARPARAAPAQVTISAVTDAASFGPRVAQLSVKYGSGQSNSFGFLVMSAAPGIFQDSSNNAAAQDANYHAIATKNPAVAADRFVDRPS